MSKFTPEASANMYATLKNALITIHIMSLPRMDNSAASAKDLLQIMKASFEEAIQKAEGAKP